MRCAPCGQRGHHFRKQEALWRTHLSEFGQLDIGADTKRFVRVGPAERRRHVSGLRIRVLQQRD